MGYKIIKNNIFSIIVCKKTPFVRGPIDIIIPWFDSAQANSVLLIYLNIKKIMSLDKVELFQKERRGEG